MALIVLMTLGCISATMQGQINQIEIWFSILVRNLLRRSSFISKTQLKARILEFINYFNRSKAKPFLWTYKGKSLTT